MARLNHEKSSNAADEGSLDTPEGDATLRTPMEMYLREINGSPLIEVAEEMALADVKLVGDVAWWVLHRATVRHLEALLAKRPAIGEKERPDGLSRAGAAEELEHFQLKLVELIFGTDEKAQSHRSVLVTANDYEGPTPAAERLRLRKVVAKLNFTNDDVAAMKADFVAQLPIVKVCVASEPMITALKARCEALTSPEEMEDVVVGCISDGAKARERLVTCNLRFVVNRARNAGVPASALMNMISAGNFALMAAVERYDSCHQVKFTTYASWWLKRVMQYDGDRQRGAARLPAYARDLLAKVEATKGVGDVSDTDALRTIGIREARIPKLLRVIDKARRANASNSGQGGEADESELTIEDVAGQVDSELDVEKREQIEVLQKFVGSLDGEYRDFAELRWGLRPGDTGPRTLKAVGDVLLYTRERARQIEAEVKKLLAKAMGDGFGTMSETFAAAGTTTIATGSEPVRAMGFAVNDHTGAEPVLVDQTAGLVTVNLSSGADFPLTNDQLVKIAYVNVHQLRARNARYNVPSGMLVLCEPAVHGVFIGGSPDFERTEEVQLLPVSRVRQNDLSKRVHSGAESIASLATRILRDGMEEPLFVCQDGSQSNGTVILEGRRRRFAVDLLIRQLNLDPEKVLVPCSIHALVRLTDEQQLQAILAGQLNENAPGPVGTARTLMAYRHSCGATDAEIAEKFSIAPGFLHDLFNLLQLPPDIQVLVDEGKIPSTHALRLPFVRGGAAVQRGIARAIMNGSGMTLLQLNAFIDAQSKSAGQAVLTGIAEAGRRTGQNGKRKGPDRSAGRTQSEVSRTHETSPVYGMARSLLREIAPTILTKDASQVAPEWEPVMQFTLGQMQADDLAVPMGNETRRALGRWMDAKIPLKFRPEQPRVVEVLAYWSDCKDLLTHGGESTVLRTDPRYANVEFPTDTGRQRFTTADVVADLDEKMATLSKVVTQYLPMVVKARELFAHRFDVLEQPAAHVLFNKHFLSRAGLNLGQLSWDRFKIWLSGYGAERPVRSELTSPTLSRVSVAELYICVVAGLKGVVDVTGGGRKGHFSLLETSTRLAPVDPPGSTLSNVGSTVTINQLMTRLDILSGLISTANLSV